MNIQNETKLLLSFEYAPKGHPLHGFRTELQSGHDDLSDLNLRVRDYQTNKPSKTDYASKKFFDDHDLFVCFVGDRIDEDITWAELPDGEAYGAKTAYEFDQMYPKLKQKLEPLIWVFTDETAPTHPALQPILDAAQADPRSILVLPVRGPEGFKTALIERLRLLLGAKARGVPTFLPGFDWAEVTPGPVHLEYGEFFGAYGGETWMVSQRRAAHVDAPFAIAKTPITNAQYAIFIGDSDGYEKERWWDFSPEAKAWRAANPRSLMPRDAAPDQPRTQVSWFDAVAFCRWLESRMKLGAESQVRLPTDAEWQRAALGDNLAWRYPWGDDLAGIADRANIKGGLGHLTAAGAYPGGASPFGALDMAGNVWQWTGTVYRAHNDLSEASLHGDDLRVLRGGSFALHAEYARAAARLADEPGNLHETIGFRPLWLRPR